MLFSVDKVMSRSTGVVIVSHNSASCIVACLESVLLIFNKLSS
jgi:hypothetical protein